jgi:hypothetical protein
MPTSTIAVPSVRVLAHEAAAEVTALLLYWRDAIAKRAPRDKQVHDSRRKIACGQAIPAEMLLVQSLTDLADGAPLALVAEPYRYILTMLEHAADRGGQVPANVASLLPLHVRETRAQYALDEAQARVLANPDDPEALADAERQSAVYDAAQEAYAAGVRRRRLAITATPSRRVRVSA